MEISLAATGENILTAQKTTEALLVTSKEIGLKVHAEKTKNIFKSQHKDR
jgi:hypothetical protein